MAQIQIHDGRIEQQAVEQVENAADAGEKVAGILHARLAFEQRFDQVANDGGGAQHHAEDDRVHHVHAIHMRRQKNAQTPGSRRSKPQSRRRNLPMFCRG